MGIVLAHRHMPPWPITALVLFFGACHGYAHGLEIPKSVSPVLYTLGFLISTSMLHIFGVVIGEVATMQKWLWKGLRFTGGVVGRGVLAANTGRDGPEPALRAGNGRQLPRMTIEVCDYFTGSGGVPPKQAVVVGTRDITADADSPCAASFASPRRATS